MTGVTVCVPTIPTRERSLRRAVASIEIQTRLPEQLVVIRDEAGVGAAPTRNEAWQRAEHEWVAFLDDDDQFRPNHIEALLNCAEQTGADLVYPWFNILDNAGNDMTERDPLRLVVDGKMTSPFGQPFGDAHRHELLHRNNFIPVTVLVRRALLEEVGGFPRPNTPEWPENCCEDWGLWRRLLAVGATFAHHPERTWFWYWHGLNTSGLSWKEGRKLV